MKWSIPAKTFLLGEYAALEGKSAIILTTAPYFELSVTSDEKTHLIHKDSPAGLWLQKHPIDSALSWKDPYQGQGGLGASSAQFLACYLASKGSSTFDLESMLEAYYQSAWSGKGLRPSGYDVIAQSQYGCVYINKNNNTIEPYTWPFQDLAFFLIHTGCKLATHQYLQETTLPSQTTTLSSIVEETRKAFIHNDSNLLLLGINTYHQQLLQLHKVAPHSLKLINKLKSYEEILAIKGCGAMGSDIILVLCQFQDKASLRTKLELNQLNILASESDITAAR